MNTPRPRTVAPLLLCLPVLILTTGSGWPVYDAANHVENLRSSTLLTELLQRYDGSLLPNLRDILQVEHRQYDAWQDYLRRLGDPASLPAGEPGSAGSGGPAWSWGDLTGPAWGMAVGSMFDGRGALTLYGHLGEGGWRELVLGSWRRWAEQARDAWLEELGAAAGWSQAEQAMAAWLAGLSPGELRARRHEVARNLARLAAERWLESGDERRQRLELLDQVAVRQREQARRPATILEALVQGNEAVAHVTTTLIEGLRSQGEGAEAGLLLQRALVEEAADEVQRRRRERILEWANVDAP